MVMKSTQSLISNLMLHGYYFLVLLFELSFNCLEFKKNHLKYMLSIGIIYMGANFLYVKTHKKALYPGLTFNNWISLGYVVAGFTILYIAYLIGTYITEKFKRE